MVLHVRAHEGDSNYINTKTVPCGDVAGLMVHGDVCIVSTCSDCAALWAHIQWMYRGMASLVFTTLAKRVKL